MPRDEKARKSVQKALSRPRQGQRPKTEYEGEYDLEPSPQHKKNLFKSRNIKTKDIAKTSIRKELSNTKTC